MTVVRSQEMEHINRYLNERVSHLSRQLDSEVIRKNQARQKVEQLLAERERLRAEVAKLKAAAQPCLICTHPAGVHERGLCLTRIDSACICGCAGAGEQQ